MKDKNQFSYEDLIAHGNGELPGQTESRLPAPPMLMFDRIVQINDHGGEYGKGIVLAELDIKPDLWFFDWFGFKHTGYFRDFEKFQVSFG